MNNSVIFIGNTSSGKSSLINYLFGYNLRTTALEDIPVKSHISVNKKDKKFIDTWGLNTGFRKISDFAEEIKFAHIICIVCKYDTYKSKETEEYLNYCKFQRKDFMNENILIVVTHSDKIRKKQPELFKKISEYFINDVYFVDTRLKSSKEYLVMEEGSLKKKIEEDYKNWLFNEFENKLLPKYSDLKDMTTLTYCFCQKKIELNCSHSFCNENKNLVFPEVMIFNENLMSIDFSKLKYIYKCFYGI